MEPEETYYPPWFDKDRFFIEIHTAASIGAAERLQEIIEKYSNEDKEIINQPNKAGWTALMYAACCSNINTVLLLLEEGANTSLKNNKGCTALTLAAKYGHTDASKLLVDNEADVNSTDLNGWSALFHAASHGHLSVVQLLVEKGANVNLIERNQGFTPLMLAAAAGQKMIVDNLLQSGADAKIQTKGHKTALSLAAQNGHSEIKELIDSHIEKQIFLSLMSCTGLSQEKEYEQSESLPELLAKLKLSKYQQTFDVHEIDIASFWALSDEDLKNMGIQLLGPRKKLVMAIDRWHQKCHQNCRFKEQINELNGLLMQERGKNADLKQRFTRATEAVQHFANSTSHLQLIVESTRKAQEQLDSLVRDDSAKNDILVQIQRISNMLSLVRAIAIDCTRHGASIKHI